MAGTTTNYGFPYPTSTDLVRNGATAIQSLATALDAYISDSEAVDKLIDRVRNDQVTTAYSRSVSSTGFVILNSPSSLSYTFTLGKSGVALVIYGGNISGATAGVTYYVSTEITGASITGFGASQSQAIVCTGTNRSSGGATMLVDGTPGGTVTVAIHGKSSSATASVVTLNDHFLTAVTIG
jgi:hypothetical protein